MKPQDHIGAHVNGLKSSIHALEVQITILKQLCGLAPAKPGKAAEETEETENEETETEDSEGDDFGAKPSKRGKKSSKSFDDEGEGEETEDESENEETEDESENEETEDESEAEETEAKPAKNAKAKKLTADDVNDACKELVGRTNRATVIGILRKFRVKTVSDLDPSDYEAAIKAFKKGK
jgi:hypothetical protein